MNSIPRDDSVPDRPDGEPDGRWPRRVYGVGDEPDPRFSFANERTFLAWIRTGLGFLAAGVAVAAVGQYGGTLVIETRIAAIILIVCGLASAAGAMSRWVRNERALRLNKPLPSPHMMPLLTAVIVVVALVAVVVVSLL